MPLANILQMKAFSVKLVYVFGQHCSFLHKVGIV
ncbi:MAG: hypothetical protein RIR11_1429 [Bacteroidota bacterium]|jgi:hypothetical protein